MIILCNVRIKYCTRELCVTVVSFSRATDRAFYRFPLYFFLHSVSGMHTLRHCIFLVVIHNKSFDGLFNLKKIDGKTLLSFAIVYHWFYRNVGVKITNWIDDQESKEICSCCVYIFPWFLVDSTWQFHDIIFRLTIATPLTFVPRFPMLNINRKFILHNNSKWVNAQRRSESQESTEPDTVLRFVKSSGKWKFLSILHIVVSFAVRIQ